MLLSSLILLPLFGIVIISIYREDSSVSNSEMKPLKLIALVVTLVDLIISLTIWFLFDNSSKHFQFIQEHYTVGYYDLYLGLDGLSIYFVLLTTLIAPISIISNWKSINTNVPYFLIIILLLESALLLIYSVLDLLMFYIFFESILAPLFILIGFFGSVDKIRASFYFFLYTFLGSLFMLLSIITVSSLTGTTDMDIVYKTDFVYITQVFLFLGIFVAFAVKTPVIFLNSWLLKAHVESPLSGSVILAAIVLKLSLYGVFRLILPLAPKSFIFYTYIIFVICVITILYASFSTIRTIDVKELIAYSSVSHAAVYFAGILSNVLHGIQGGILLGLAHGFVSSGLFISGGGVLYDRSGTRTINYYGGLAQLMPIFSTVFFILCLGNCGAPLTLNFVGEFMSLYGVFERLSLAGILGSTSIVLSAAYTIFMFNRIILGGVFKGWHEYLSDLTKREYAILLLLVLFTVILGIYPSIILDTLNYAVSSILFSFDNVTMNASYFPDIGYHKTFHSRSFFEYVADNQPGRSDIAWNNTTHTHVDIYNPDIPEDKKLVFDRNVAVFNPNSHTPNIPEYIGRPHNVPEHYYQYHGYVACFSGKEETEYQFVDNTLPHKTYGYNNDFKLEDKFTPAKNTLPSHRFAYCNPANYK